MMALCEAEGLAHIANAPLAMSMLTGKFDAGTRFGAGDVRQGWDLATGPQARQLQQVEALREILTTGGRTVAQGALAWLWARSSATVPIPGCKTVRQAEENAAAMAFGPLSAGRCTRWTRCWGAKAAAGHWRQGRGEHDRGRATDYRLPGSFALRRR
jgi:aryl-alcohol dehydrogenase-like predicted oxidoreductase